MENANDKNLTARGFDESNDYTPPKTGTNISEDDVLTDEEENEDLDESLIDEEDDAITLPETENEPGEDNGFFKEDEVEVEPGEEEDEDDDVEIRDSKDEMN